MSALDFLFRKQRHIEALVQEYLDHWQACLESFESAMQSYLERGLGEEFGFLVDRTHKEESKADDQRRRIEHEMYAKGLLPESRGDILGFLESIDRVPSAAEQVLFMILDEGVELPLELVPELRELVAVSLETTGLLLQMARDVFGHRVDPFPLVRQIDDRESRGDHLERDLITKIFNSGELENWRRLQLRDLVAVLGDLADRAQTVSDRLFIMGLKRRV